MGIFTSISWKQCVANCLMAVAYTSTMPIDEWWSENLDCILLRGNKFYFTTESNYDYLMVSDIPDVVTQYDGHYRIISYEEMFRTLDENKTNPRRMLMVLNQW